MIHAKSRHHYHLGTAFALFLFGAVSLWAQQPPPDGHDTIDIWTMARRADFIFKGRVVDVKYRNSEFVQVTDPTGKPVFDENNQPVGKDGSNLPHSFVVYQIERIYKGKPPTQTPNAVTLRLVGGVDADVPEDIVFVPHYPHMDPADRDVLFVMGNTFRPCPLVQSEVGRFRIIVDPKDGQAKIYNEVGQEVLHIRHADQTPDEVDVGPYHHFPEVTTYHFGNCDGCTIERHIDESLDEDPKPAPGVPKGPQFTEDVFDNFVGFVVAQTHTPEELQQVPPVVSADISRPFFAESYSEDAPKDIGPETPVIYGRPWLDELSEEQREAILESERIELQLLAQTDGNPVLPSNPCEMRILTEGAIPGDISGPMGRPDCYVNLHDAAVMAEYWLECSDPRNTACQGLLDF